MMGLKVMCVMQVTVLNTTPSVSLATLWYAFNYKAERFRTAEEITYSAVCMGKCSRCYPCLQHLPLLFLTACHY